MAEHGYGCLRKSSAYESITSGIRMSPDNQGGFVRNWIRPDDRIATHLGYAYQWFGFAFAAFAIYLFVGFRRGKQASLN